MKFAATFLLLITLFTGTQALFAQEEAGYMPLEPIPQLTAGGDNCNPNAPDDNCKTTLGSFIPNAFKLIIQIAGALAVIMIVIGGFQYASTDALNDKKEGREKIKNALYGLLLAIGAFIILNTLNPGILSLDLSIHPIRTTSLPTEPTVPQDPLSPPRLPQCDTVASGTPCTNISEPEREIWPSDEPWRSRLAQFNPPIRINKINCLRIGASNCTSVFELGGANTMTNKVINGLVKLNEECRKITGCFIEITGGTEYWLHGNRTLSLETNRTLHKPGGSAVDITMRNSQLNDIIRNYPEITGANGCATGYSAYKVHGATYVDEISSDRHWHICF